VGDPGVLRQIVVNLVGNAIKFTEQGEVNVRVERESEEEGRACLHSGPGHGNRHPVESQTRIFEAFAQADSSTTRRYGGTVWGDDFPPVVEMMGGRIWLESTPGKARPFTSRCGWGEAIKPSRLRRSRRTWRAWRYCGGRQPHEPAHSGRDAQCLAYEAGTGGERPERHEQPREGARCGRSVSPNSGGRQHAEVDGFALVEQIRQNPG